MLLYHMNVGYPLLCEQAVVSIPSSRVTPRDARAAEGLDRWDKVESPTPGFKEQCYFHQFEQQGKASVYNPEKKVGLEISFDTEELPLFTEWKMMGVRDYVLGLEPGNCHPNGRNIMRQEGNLSFIEPGTEKNYSVRVTCFE